MFRELTLYHYWRSSSSWRVRWALELKGLKTKHIAVDLLDGSNESREHLSRNPLGYVPVLSVDGRNLFESMSILEWLDEVISTPALFTGDVYDRQHLRSLCELINASTQPLQNPNVTEMVSGDLEQRKEWNQHWIRRGLHAFQTTAAPRSGLHVFGNQITAADLFLVPQCYAAERFEVNLDEFPLVKKWNIAALATPEARATHPDRFKP